MLLNKLSILCIRPESVFPSRVHISVKGGVPISIHCACGQCMAALELDDTQSCLSDKASNVYHARDLSKEDREWFE